MSSELRTGTDHKVDLPSTGMTPFSKLLNESTVSLVLLMIFQLEQTLMHKIEGVVNQLGSLLGCHWLTKSMAGFSEPSEQKQ